jgi:hypothetical protein
LDGVVVAVVGFFLLLVAFATNSPFEKNDDGGVGKGRRRRQHIKERNDAIFFHAPTKLNGIFFIIISVIWLFYCSVLIKIEEKKRETQIFCICTV